MDKYERRRLRLKELRDSRCSGNSAELARKIERHPSYVTRMLYQEGKPGKKRIADDMMEIIENAFGLARGWLDRDAAGLSEATAEPVVVSIRPTEPDIAAVVDLMRGMCAAQRGEVLGYARRVAETSPAAGKANAAQ